jgi:hypothetical protein
VKIMPIHDVPDVIKGHAVPTYPPRRGAGERTGAVPTGADQQACLETPFICGARMEGCTVELAGDARRLD